ncbi:MAG: PKD domain-containing protein [Ferruginibacter sp.]
MLSIVTGEVYARKISNHPYNNPMKLFLILSAFFLSSLTCAATTYYISPLGNDITGNGSFLNPWKTLYKATSTISTSGDIIHVNTGVYTETVQCALAVGVSIEGDGITSVIQSTLTANFTPILSLSSAVEGTNGNQHISNLKFDGQNLSSAWGISVVARSNVSIHDCTVVNFREVGVNFSGITGQNAPYAPTVYATGNTFYNNTVTNCSTNDTVYGRGCMQFGGQTGMLVYNNIITQPYRTGTFTGNIGWPMKMANEGHVKDCKVYNNTLARALFTNTVGHGVNNDWNFSFEMWNIEGLEMYGNTLQGEVDIVNATKGGSAYGLDFHDNVVSYPSLSSSFQSGLRLETNESDIIISNNYFHNMEQGIAFSPHDYLGNGFGIDIHRVTIKNNLFTNMGVLNNTANSTIRFEGTQVNMSDLFIYNNTLVGGTGASNTFMGILIPAYSGSVINTKIINNIIANYIYTPIFFGTVLNTLAVQNNNLYNNANSNSPMFNGGAAINYTNSGNTVSTPLFVGAGNYTLQAASLNIDAGVNVGLVYNGGGPDIGYAEYGGVTNLSPTADAGVDQFITLPTNSVNLTGAGNDPDGTIISYLWSKVTGPTAGTIANANSAATSVTGLVQGIYKFELRVSDNNGAFARDTMQVTVNPDPNIAPTANAGADQNITLPTNSANLDGLGNDPDGTISTYLWTKIAGPTAGTIANANAANTSVTGLIQGTYRFELRVTDNNGATGRDTMQVIVNPAPNVVPTASAGADQNITLPTNTVNLSGTGNDPDGTITAYLWTKITGPTAGSITNANAANTSVTGLIQGTYQFELRVTDNSGAFGRDTMLVIVNPDPNIAPTANAGIDQIITLPINTVNLTGSGNDPDGTIISYLWSKIAGPTAGVITNVNSAATTVAGLVQGTYRFELRVTDNNGAIGRDTMQVTVNPDPNIAPTANAGADQNITLPQSVVNLLGSGNDPDGTITAYLWTKIAGPTAGTITNANAAFTTATALVQGTYRFELRVTDNNGATGRDTMQVIVNPVPNITPTANAGVDQNITLPTNTISLSGSGNDPDGTISAYRWTKITGPTAGAITNANTAVTSVTGLVQGVYQFELRVTDNSGAFGRDTMQVTVNAAPNVAPTANAGADQNITLPTNTISLSGSGNDPDGTITAYLWTKITGPTAGTITNASNASTSVTGLIQGTYQFELRVTDNSGAYGRDTMEVIVNPAANIAPNANAGANQAITLPQSVVNLLGSGNDPDGTITAYLWTKIAGPTAGIITNANTAFTTVTGLIQGMYQFELRVTDNSGAIGKDTMQVTVNPAPNVAPTANAGIDQAITLPTNFITLTGSGNDPDGTITTYLWTKIAGPAAGTITNANSATTSVTGLAGGIYKFELQVTDNSGATAKDTMQLVVFVPNIAPTANAGLNQSITLPTNIANLLGSGNDIDGVITTYKWTKIAGPASGIITNSNVAFTSVTGLAAGAYLFELRVTDNNGASGRDTMQVTVNPANIPPVANAGPDQFVILPATNVTLTGTGTDADGTVVAYAWKQISGPADKLTSPGTAVTILDNLIQGTYKFELTVTDNRGATDKDTVSVTASVAIAPTKNTVNVYPNPIVNLATVDINTTSNNSALLLVITDMNGKSVYTKQLSGGSYNIKEQVNMSSLAKGVYLITVYFDSQNKQTIKAVKQ